MKKTIIKALSLLCVFALVLAGCGGKETPAPETDPAVRSETMELTSWTLDSTIWSSANGATVNLKATPAAYHDGMEASFVVKLEGEDVWNQPCEWDGKTFTSYADLNAEDGYFYYVVLTGADGSSATVEVNTSNNPVNQSLIALETALECYCTLTVSDAAYESGDLTLIEGSADIQVPQLTNNGETVTVTSADLVLNLDGGALIKETLDLPAEVNAEGIYSLSIAGAAFKVPELEGDHQLSLSLQVELSNGLVLTDEESTSWFYSDGALSLTVG